MVQYQKIRIIASLVLLFYCSNSVTAQDNYIKYTYRIMHFFRPYDVSSQHVDKDGNGYIEYSNNINQILRFRLLNHKPQILHGGIVYQLFYYENGFLYSLETFDINGKLTGERESKNEATTKFIVEKKEEYLKKKKLIDDAEGNIDLKDDSIEKIIRVKFFDAAHQPINELKPTYISSKTFWNYNVRMYWP